MTTEKKDPVDLVEESVGTSLLKQLVTEFQHLPAPWHQMNADRQGEVIDRLRGGVEDGVRAVVKAVCSRSFTHLGAEIESLTFKDGAKAVLKLQRSGDAIHELADGVGGQCMVVLATVAEFTDGMHTVAPTPDQADFVEQATAAQFETTADHEAAAAA